MGNPAAVGPVRVSQLDYGDEAAVSRFYQDVLLPNFRDGEVEAEDELAEGYRDGEDRALVATAPDGSMVGGCVFEWYPASRVLLLSYLAVQASYRDQGTGRQLLEAGLGTWNDELRPVLVVTEVEDPRHYHDTEFGDAARRFRFYGGAGARALSVPYFQPALGPGASRVPHLMLMVLGGTGAPPATPPPPSPSAPPPPPPAAQRVDGRVIERFLAEYLEQAEGQAHPEDAQARALFAACRQPGGIPLLPVGTLPPD
jgi:predicted N-acetyltransferase YhbS